LKKEEFFGSPTVLTVSGQLHLEAAASSVSNSQSKIDSPKLTSLKFRSALKRVYNFNPAFRAERQQSRRHLSEFWMIEAEVAFLDNLDDLLLVSHSSFQVQSFSFLQVFFPVD
jgi:asparaginyl-tRNA synthetase